MYLPGCFCNKIEEKQEKPLTTTKEDSVTQARKTGKGVTWASGKFTSVTLILFRLASSPIKGERAPALFQTGMPYYTLVDNIFFLIFRTL